jgi:hypothetical protein
MPGAELPRQALACDFCWQVDEEQARRASRAEAAAASSREEAYDTTIRRLNYKTNFPPYFSLTRYGFPKFMPQGAPPKAGGSKK